MIIDRTLSLWPEEVSEILNVPTATLPAYKTGERTPSAREFQVMKGLALVRPEPSKRLANAAEGSGALELPDAALFQGRRPRLVQRTSMLSEQENIDAGSDLLRFAKGRRFKTILADPPWQSSTGPERWPLNIGGCPDIRL